MLVAGTRGLRGWEWGPLTPSRRLGRGAQTAPAASIRDVTPQPRASRQPLLPGADPGAHLCAHAPVHTRLISVRTGEHAGWGCGGLGGLDEATRPCPHPSALGLAPTAGPRGQTRPRGRTRPARGDTARLAEGRTRRARSVLDGRPGALQGCGGRAGAASPVGESRVRAASFRDVRGCPCLHATPGWARDPPKGEGPRPASSRKREPSWSPGRHPGVGGEAGRAPLTGISGGTRGSGWRELLSRFKWEQRRGEETPGRPPTPQGRGTPA